MSRWQDIAAEGLWRNNAGLVQLLGLCPLLAVTSSVVNGLGLGLATTATLVVSGLTVSAVRGLVRPEIRIPVFVLVIACTVTAIELLMSAWLHDLYKVLGIFIPLIVTNCAIMGRAEAFASRNPVPAAVLDGLMMGLGFTGVLVALGALRELAGHGTLLDHAELLLGPLGEGLRLELIPGYRGFLVAVLPPGAFIGLGLLIALKNVIDARRGRRPVAVPVHAHGHGSA